MPQDVEIFASTARENIRFGRSDATDADIEEAAKAADAHNFISDLPNGYETYVGERVLCFLVDKSRELLLQEQF